MDQTPISQQQAQAQHQTQQLAIRLESSIARLKRQLRESNKNSIAGATIELRTLIGLAHELSDPLRDYLIILDPPKPRSEILRKLDPKTWDKADTDPGAVISAIEQAVPLSTKFCFPSLLDTVGYLEGPQALPGLKKHQVEALQASVLKARPELNLANRPSDKDWPEAIQVIGEPSVGMEVLWWWGWQRCLIWDYRQRGIPPAEWQGIDEDFYGHSYCNAFRVLDGVSQYVVELCLQDDAMESFDTQFLEVILCKIFNEIRTNRYLQKHAKHLLTVKTFDPDKIRAMLAQAQESGELPRLFRPSYRYGIGAELVNSLGEMLRVGAPGHILKQRGGRIFCRAMDS
jgi:hypothetical protein